MASQWYRQTPHGELGPFAFAQLVESVRAGTLQSEGLVRRAGQSQWQRAGDVVGLFRAARLATDAATGGKFAGDAAEPESSLDVASRQFPLQEARGAADATAATSQTTTKRRGVLSAEMSTWSVVGVAAGIPATLMLAVAGWYWHRAATRFPVPAGLRPQPLTEHFFFGWGPLGLIEYVIIWADVCLVVAFLAYLAVSWFLRAPRNERRRSSRERI